MFERMRLLDVVVDAAQREREVLLVGLAEHELDRAVVELDDVLEHEQQAAHLGGELLVGLGQRVEHVALGRTVGVVEDLGQRLDPAGGGVLLLHDAVELLLITPSICLTTSGLVSPMRAMRSAMSACSWPGRCESTCEASDGVQVGHDQRHRLGRLVAQEGDQLLGRASAQELERPHLDHAREPPDDLERPLGPERTLEHLAGVVDAAGHQRVVRLDGGGELLEHRWRWSTGRPAGAWPSPATASRSPRRAGA